MSGGAKKFAKVYNDPFGLFDRPDKPRVKPPPKIDEKEANRRADLVRRVRRQRAIAAHGFSDTRKTGPSGLGPSASPAGGIPANKRALLGA